jgi:N-acetylmuramoyl-L-alanine amidase
MVGMLMRKYGLPALMLLLFLLVIPGISHADSAAATHINLDGKELVIPPDAQVQTINGSVMVPLRLVAEQLGYAVKWDSVNKLVTIEQAGTTLKLVLNSPVAESAGKQVQLDNPPILSGSTTLVPLRFVSEETGTVVRWDNPTKTVFLTSPVRGNTPSPEPDKPALPSGQSAAVTGIAFSGNKLSITVDGSVTPSVFAITGKDRIVMDLPNTGFSQSFLQSMSLQNKQNGTLEVTGNPDVTAVRYSLFSNSPSTVRLVIDLNIAKTYSIINANNGTIILDLTGKGTAPAATPAPTPSAAPSATPAPVSGSKLIVIDAGHGGKDPGSISVNKYKEKDFTLATALMIEKLLSNEPNIKVVLTRNNDTYPTLQDRAKLANTLKADLFLSIHANSIPATSKSNPSGVETYYTREDSLKFAKVVHKFLVPATGLTDRSVRQNNYYVTRETTMPAILLECGYLSNVKDEALLFSEDFQQRIAEAVVAGIKEYLAK